MAQRPTRKAKKLLARHRHLRKDIQSPVWGCTIPPPVVDGKKSQLLPRTGKRKKQGHKNEGFQVKEKLLKKGLCLARGLGKKKGRKGRPGSRVRREKPFGQRGERRGQDRNKAIIPGGCRPKKPARRPAKKPECRPRA